MASVCLLCGGLNEVFCSQSKESDGLNTARQSMHKWSNVYCECLAKGAHMDPLDQKPKSGHVQVMLPSLPSCATSSEHVRVGYQTYQIHRTSQQFFLIFQAC